MVKVVDLRPPPEPKAPDAFGVDCMEGNDLVALLSGHAAPPLAAPKIFKAIPKPLAEGEFAEFTLTRDEIRDLLTWFKDQPAPNSLNCFKFRAQFKLDQQGTPP